MNREARRAREELPYKWLPLSLFCGAYTVYSTPFWGPLPKLAEASRAGKMGNVCLPLSRVRERGI